MTAVTTTEGWPPQAPIVPTAQGAPSRRRRRDPRLPAWEERSSIAGHTVRWSVLGFYVVAVLLPLYVVAITSLSTQAAINRAGGLVLVPDGITFDSYKLIFSGGVVARAAVISLVITAVGTLFSMVVTVLAAYGLSRSDSFAHKAILVFMMFTTFFSGGLIPLFIVVSQLHGYNAYWSLILPSALSIFNVIVMRQFFMGTGAEIIESARIDGAGEWGILARIVLPMSKAVSAVIALFYAIGYWDSWFNVLLFMPADSSRWPLSYVLYQYVTLGTSMAGTGITSGQNYGHQALAPLSLQMAIAFLVALPILIVLPFAAKHFRKGLLLGAIKG